MGRDIHMCIVIDTMVLVAASIGVAGGSEVIVTRNLRDQKNGQMNFPELRVIPPEKYLKDL
jgi:hypothetical protein